MKANTTVNDARSATRRTAIVALLLASGACNSAPHYYQQTDATPLPLAPRHVDEKDPQSSSQHEPFEALVDEESSDDLEARAHRALSKLDADRHRAKSRGCPDHVYAEVGDALHRARNRLAAIAEGHYDAVDDGRLHVAVAINTARQRLDRMAPTLVSVR